MYTFIYINYYFNNIFILCKFNTCIEYLLVICRQPASLQLSVLFPKLTPSQIHVLFYVLLLITHLIQLVLPIGMWLCGHILGHKWPTSSHIQKGEWLSLNTHQLQIAPSIRMEFHGPLPIYAEILAGTVQVSRNGMSWQVQQPCHVQNSSLLPVCQLLHSFFPFFN